MKPVYRNQFSPTHAGILYSCALVVGLLVQIVLGTMLSGYALSMTYSIVAPCLYIAIVWVGGRLLGVDVPAATGVRTPPAPKAALWTVVLAVCSVLAFLPLAIAVQALFDKLGYHATPNYADYTSTAGHMLLGLVGMAVMPALGEECLLRGCVFGALRGKGTYYGIVVSALLFALMHASPVQFIHQFLIGCIMAYLVYMSHTVWMSVLFHFCNNAIVILYEFVYVQTGATYQIPWWLYLVLFVVFAPLVVVLLIAFGRSVRARHAAHAQEEDRAGLDVFADESPARVPLKHRVRRFLDYDGRFVAYNTAEPFGAMYVAFLLTAVLWLANTVVGWVGLS